MAKADLGPLLGGLTARAFVARHWHKEPLLVRGAVPGFAGVATRDELFALAARDDVASRLVRRVGGRFSLEHGPFSGTKLARLPRRDFTLLVQGVNLHSDAADALLRRFAFIPYARLDDVMISYAAPGGGVGPHVDSYDVFLLQAHGRRRWRYGRQTDLELIPGAPLKILRHFAPTDDATLAPGDMLYLPPDIAHDGTAVDECMSYSIGFRAPLYQEVVEAFVDHLRDSIAVDGRYADPDLRVPAHPARIDAPLARRFARAIAELRWDAAETARFIGRFLTEPKPDVVFDAPQRASRPRFVRGGLRSGVRLDRRTQLLYDDARYYLNGDDAPLTDANRPAVQRLADHRALTASEFASLPVATTDLLYEWHRHGYLGNP
jgi:50S ribosomal protein L16 3-hydroxylase